MKKHWKTILVVSVLLFCFSGCRSRSGKVDASETASPTAAQTQPSEAGTEPSREVQGIAFYCGTWTVSGINAKGVDFTLEQAIAMGADDLEGTKLIFASSGDVCICTNGENTAGTWQITEDSVQVGTAMLPYKDGRIALDIDNMIVYFVKESDDQTIPEQESETEVTSEPTAPAASGIRPEFQEAMDTYEAFYDEYCSFMEQYKKNPTDFTLLANYAGMMTRLAEMDEKFAAWNQDEMSPEELKYYLEVNTRIQKRMIDLF